MTRIRDRWLRLRRRQALAALAGSVGALALPVLSQAAGPGAVPGTGDGGTIVGFVYVNDNAAGANTIAGFARHADGSLTALPGSPFAVGGSGTGTSIGSQGALARSADGRLLLAADAGSNQISVARINPHGSLTPVSTGPVSSNGVQPVSLAVHGALVYVANIGNGGSNYSGFILSKTGLLRAVPNSTVPLPDGSGQGDVLFNGTGTHLVGTRVTTSLIDSFVVRANGTLAMAPGSPFAAQMLGPFGSAFQPNNPTQLFVSNAHGGTNAGSISAYHVSANGTLTAVGGSPFPDLQTAPCWIAISPDGRYLFTANTGSDTISSYAIAPNGSLSLIGSTLLNGAPGLGVFDLELDPTGRFLYVVDTTRVAISILAVSGGTLTELASSPVSLPTGAAPFGLVVL
jgi:6-phosphogluconolactonase (cycloisomerase 2 family)